MSGDGSPPARLPGWLGRMLPVVLATDSYRRLWYTGLLYYQAHWMEITVTGWVVLEFTGSAASVGLVAFFRTLPMLVFGLIFGTLADRFKRVSVLGAIQITGLSAALGFALLFSLGYEILWLVCLLSAVIGCAWAADFATRRALVTELNTAENTGSAMSLEALSLQGGKIFAPIIGGLLLGVGGAPAAYVFLSGMFAFGLFGVGRLRAIGVEGRPATTSSLPLIDLLRTGWRTAVEIPIVRVALIVTVVMNLMVFPYQHLIALIAGEVLDVGPSRMGVLSGAAGLGSAVLAGYLTFRSRPATAPVYFAVGATAGAAGLVVLAFSTNFHLSVGLQLAIGACFGAFGAMQSVIVARAVEPEMRARAMGVLAMAIGTGPIGMLLTGTLSSWIGASWTIGGMAAMATVILAATILRYREELFGSIATGREQTAR